MMHHLTLIHEKRNFRLSSTSGALFSKPLKSGSDVFPQPIVPIPAKLKRALDLCDNPYRLKNPGDKLAHYSSEEVGAGTNLIAERLVKLCSSQFLLARAYAFIRKPTFDTSVEAIDFFRNSVVGDQSTLCLPRALFAAKTSRRFAEEGILFIGVFLPARSLHAWVIEGESLADTHDDIWINYRPVAALS